MREVLDRLSRGEITPDQADHDLNGLSNQAGGEATEVAESLEPDSSIGLPVSAEGRESRPSPVTVRATMNGSGQLTVVGEPITVPEVRGPASADIDRDGSGWVVGSQYADGTKLTVPADADLILAVNGANVALHDLAGTLDAKLNVAEIVLDAQLTRGASKIFANAGPLVINLAAGSDVRVELRTGCRWTVDPQVNQLRAGKWIVGGGRASLIIEGNLGNLELNGPAGE